MEPLEQRMLLSVGLLTDKLEYAPEELVTMTASGFTPGETVEFQVSRIDGAPIAEATWYEPWRITDGSQFVPDGVTDPDDATDYDLDGLTDGAVQTTWTLTGQESPGATFEVTATGLTSGEVVTVQFTGEDEEPFEAPLAVVTDKLDYLAG